MDPVSFTLLVFVIYTGFVYLVWRRLVPIVWALAIFSMILAVLAGAPAGALPDVVSKGTLFFADFSFTFALGTIFAAALMETGIVESLVRRALELGGGRPMATAIVIFLVWTYLGIGVPIAGSVMVGSITLPVQMALGIPAVIASTFHAIGGAAGQPFWLAHWVYFRTLTGVYFGNYFSMALTMTLVVVAVGLAYIVFQCRRISLPMRWATEEVKSTTERLKKVPAYAYVTPIIPIIFAFGLKLDPKVAFMASMPFPFLLTMQGSGRGLRDLYNVLERSAYRGITLLSELFAIMVFVGWVVVAAGLPQVRVPLTQVFKSILPVNPLLFVLFFAALLPFNLFRGPASPWGVGAALAIVFSKIGVLPPLAILGAVYAYNLFMGMCEPTWGTNVWTTTFTKVNPVEFMKKDVLWAALAAIIILGIVALQWVPH